MGFVDAAYFDFVSEGTPRFVTTTVREVSNVEDLNTSSVYSDDQAFRVKDELVRHRGSVIGYQHTHQQIRLYLMKHLGASLAR